VIRAAARVVLPGQSAMPDCMTCLEASGLREVVREAAGASPPFLGICLGLQMLFDESEEGPTRVWRCWPAGSCAFATRR
jgi:glutamine amidotransferase